MRRRPIIKRLVLTACLCRLVLQPACPQDNTMYFMYGIPQSTGTNPAVYKSCRTYIELPVLSSFRYSFASTGFGYHDLIHPGTGSRADSLVIDVDNLASKLKNRNYIRNDLNISLLGAGFAVRDYYFHFNVSDRFESRIGFPGDLIRIKDGNWDPANGEVKDINLGGLGAAATNYLQLKLGMAWQPNRYITAGFTVSYLMGTASLVNRRSDLYIQTEQDPYVLTGTVNYRLNASFPADISYDSLGVVSNVNFDRTLSDPVHDFILNKNRGAAVDAGILYDYSRNITLAASITDLGFIRWKSNVNRLEARGKFTFNGFDLNEYSRSAGQADFFGALLDSIRNSYKFQGTEEPYLTLLTTKIYAGGMYRFNDVLNVGLVGRTEIYDRRPHFSMTATANYSPLSYLSATLSYSVMNNKYYHLGAGLALGGPGAQFYVITDHIPVRFVKVSGTPVLFPYNARTLNIRFGVNILWGCKDWFRVKKDKRGKPVRNKNLCPAYW